MTEVVSVKFRGRGKTYYFDPAGEKYTEGDRVVVETSRGLELADCVAGNHFVPEDKVVAPLRPVVRAATEADKRVAAINADREREAMGICRRKIAQHGLDMKLVDAECSFEGNKITFYFTSDGRVDFRDLVKDLASVFRSRIELRQIGVRDEAKLLGGLGICGRPFCCNQFLDDFQPVSTKMAKVQSLSLNPTKISGSCGRLMCCLRYEEEAYEELVRSVPRNGAFVETPAGYGNVTQVNLLRRTVKVRLDGDGDDVIKSYSADEVAAIPGGRPKPGEPLPRVLKPRPAPVREPSEPPETPWRTRMSFGGEPTPATSPAAEAAPEEPRAKKRPARRGKPAVKPETAQPRGDSQDAPQPKPVKPREQKPRQTGDKKPQERPPRRQEGEQRRTQQPRAEAGGEPPRQDRPHPQHNHRRRKPGNPGAPGGTPPTA